LKICSNIVEQLADNVKVFHDCYMSLILFAGSKIGSYEYTMLVWEVEKMASQKVLMLLSLARAKIRYTFYTVSSITDGKRANDFRNFLYQGYEPG
jgi:hypothetical protein